MKTEWTKHLNKLAANYNYYGAPCLHMLTYADCNVTDFLQILKGYEPHILKINPGKFTYCNKFLVCP